MKPCEYCRTPTRGHLRRLDIDAPKKPVKETVCLDCFLKGLPFDEGEEFIPPEGQFHDPSIGPSLGEIYPQLEPDLEKILEDLDDVLEGHSLNLVGVALGLLTDEVAKDLMQDSSPVSDPLSKFTATIMLDRIQQEFTNRAEYSDDSFIQMRDFDEKTEGDEI